MFCYQCEQTTHGIGCEQVGVCGKTPTTAALQDLLVHRLKGLASWAVYAKDTSSIDIQPAGHLFRAAIFSTLTNVNFDAPRFVERLADVDAMTADLRGRVQAAGAPPLSASPVAWFPGGVHPVDEQTPTEGVPQADLVRAGRVVGVDARSRLSGDPTLVGLHELVTYGVKGAAAYAHHAAVGGCEETDATEELLRAMAFLCTPDAADAGAVLERALAVGAANLTIMAALERAHTSAFGHPSPAQVRMGPREGKALLVSGHDLTDLMAVLQQTEGTGIKVYTHGELLPAHGYPELRRHAHLAGHYGGAWYRQKGDFARFPGAILMTTNCVLEPPKGTYAANLFTTGETGVPGVTHVGEKAFAPVIARALELPGFTAADEAEGDAARPHLVGFGREATLGAAPAVLDAIGKGQLQRIFLIGGCDGSEGSRRYYQRLASDLPPASMVLTLGCAKFRLLGQDFGAVPGTDLPRLLDMGQCNDAHAAIQVAVALAKAIGAASVNDLPLSIDLSWFEQKAVAVLLSLLHLGVRDIRLGPSLPAFVTPAALAIVQERFGLKHADMKHPEEDLAAMLRSK